MIFSLFCYSHTRSYSLHHTYTGLTLACLSILLYFPIKSVTKKTDGDESINSETQPLVIGAGEWDEDRRSLETSEEKSAAVAFRKKVVGVSLSVVAGLLYGTNMLPISYLQQKYVCGVCGV